MPSYNVIKYVIKPLDQWFDKSISAGKAEVYEELLAGINADVLKLTIKNLKQEWNQQSCPQPSVVLAHARKAQAQIVNNTAKGQHNFGQLSNGNVCTCGKHHGVGQWTPEKRAQSYAWSRKQNHHFHGPIKDYLESYEAEHGCVEP